jgi:hypothetical protein
VPLFVSIVPFCIVSFASSGIASAQPRSGATVAAVAAAGTRLLENLDFVGGYYPGQAQDNFRLRLPRPKKRKVDGQPGLWIYILRLLELRWSPMQISKHMSETHEDDASMRLSAESICQAVYIQGKGVLAVSDRWLPEAMPGAGIRYPHRLCCSEPADS